MSIYQDLSDRLTAHGLRTVGGFDVGSDDPIVLPSGQSAKSAVLIGNSGQGMWEHFSKSAEFALEQNPLEAWIRNILTAIAEDVTAHAVFPSDGPPYYPFQQWAKRTGRAFSSPIGILITPDAGLWHAYRAAFLFDRNIDLPAPLEAPSPCETCADQPCLTTCPVAAFSAESYDVPACSAHLHTPQGPDCMEQGCRARRACPVGRDHIYPPALAAFHMSAFRASHPIGEITE